MEDFQNKLKKNPSKDSLYVLDTGVSTVQFTEVPSRCTFLSLFFGHPASLVKTSLVKINIPLKKTKGSCLEAKKQ